MALKQNYNINIDRIIKNCGAKKYNNPGKITGWAQQQFLLDGRISEIELGHFE